MSTLEPILTIGAVPMHRYLRYRCLRVGASHAATSNQRHGIARPEQLGVAMWKG
jgi:hypothetical protein